MLARVLSMVGATDSVRPSIGNHALSASAQEPNSAEVGIRLLPDGTLQIKQGGAYTSVAGQWATPKGPSVGGLFNARLSRIAGAVVSGPTGYVPMTTTREWTLSQSGRGDKTFSGQLQLQRGATVVSSDVTMTVSVDGASVTVTNKTINGFAISPATASAAIRFLPDGTMQQRGSNTSAPFGEISGQWGSPKQPLLGNQYDIRLTRTSGVTPSGDVLGAWLSMGSMRTWDVQSSGIANFTGTLEIRQGSTIIDSAAITLNATQDTGF